MPFRVKQTRQADRDLDVILEWLMAQQAGEAALRWFHELQEVMQSLSEFPQRCPLALENTEFAFEVRQLVHGHKPHAYRILFTIDADMVVILHIRHSRRLPLIKT